MFISAVSACTPHNVVSRTREFNILADYPKVCVTYVPGANNFGRGAHKAWT